MPLLQSLQSAAARAASAGEFDAAAGLFQQVLDLQVEALGSNHPALEATYRAMALMLEKGGDSAAAGDAYRRALDIAVAAYGSDAATVAVSRAHLAAFVNQFGAGDNDTTDLLVGGGLDDFTPVPPAIAPPRPWRSPHSFHHAPRYGGVSRAAIRVSPGVPRVRGDGAFTTIESASAARVRRHNSGRLPIFAARTPPAPRIPPLIRPVPRPDRTPAWTRAAGGTLILALGILLAGIPAWWLRERTPGSRAGASRNPGKDGVPSSTLTSGSEVAPLPGGSNPSSALSGSNAAALLSEARLTPLGPREEEATDDPAIDGTRESDVLEPGATPPATRVTEAGLCGALSAGAGPWRCEPTRSVAEGGSVYYYTRVAAPRDTLVRHRWSRDGREVRVMVLRILGPTTGFPTFSEQSGMTLKRGTWNVALVAPDGTVLDQSEFIVRGAPDGR